MLNYRPKHRVKVDGQMHPEDAGIVGKRLANAALIAAIGFSCAAIIAALGTIFA